jgi:hypothetical protein
VGTEAVECAVELIIGIFQLWSNLPMIDGISPIPAKASGRSWRRA